MKTILYRLIEAICEYTEAIGKKSFDAMHAYFAFDDQITYSDQCEIAKSNIYQVNQFEKILEEETRGGPSWVHANLIIPSEGIPLVSISKGNNVGNPEPTINLSHEIKEIKILGERKP